MKRFIFVLSFMAVFFSTTAMGLQYTHEDSDLVYQYSIENEEIIIDRVIVRTVSDAEVVFPDEIEGYPVTKIKKDACDSYAENISKIVLPADLKEIEDNTFERYSNLHTVVFNDGLENIGNSAFYKCKKLNSIEIPKGVKNIGNSAFYDCIALKNAIIPGSVETIGDSAFYNCTSLENVTFFRKLCYIREFAFYGCNSLMKLIIPNSVTEIGNYAFGECTNLKELVIPAHLVPQKFEDIIDVTTVFDKDNAIEKIIVKNGICNNANLWYWFRNTVWAESNKPKTETGFYIIDNILFYYDGDTKNPIIPPDVKIIDSFAFKGTKINTVTIPSTVKTVGKRAFAFCDNLSSLIIEDGVNTVSDEAFFGCIKLTPEQCSLSESTKYSETAFNNTPFDKNWIPSKLPKGEIIIQNKSTGPELFVNDEKILFTDAVPFIDDAFRTQMPVRAIAEALNCKVDYADGLITIQNENDIIELTIGNDIMTKNGKDTIMDTKAVIYNDRTFLPIRYIAEALNYTVKWEKTSD